MSMTANQAGATAIPRNDFSKPIKTAIRDGIICKSRTVFDYGCGRGNDIKLLQNAKIESSGWDPVHAADQPVVSADVVNLGYILNVIENTDERKETLVKAFSLAKKALVV